MDLSDVLGRLRRSLVGAARYHPVPSTAEPLNDDGSATSSSTTQFQTLSLDSYGDDGKLRGEMRETLWWRGSTPYLWYCAFAFAWGVILFGLDTGSFGSIQSLDSFLVKFGVEEDGTYKLPPTRKAIMNSIVWPGKLLGTIVFEPLLERAGYKRSMYICCVLQMIGVTIEMTSSEWIQFSLGRVIAYLTVGIIENITPSYQAEISPSALRGFFTGSLIAFTTLGNMWGSGMGRAVADMPQGWLLAVGVQYIPAVIIVLTVPFTVESPRWLAQKGHKELAIRNLSQVRPRYMTEDGSVKAEINAITDAHQGGTGVADTGTWFDLFKGTHLPRTIVASALFFFQQTCGAQFVNSYAPTFFKNMGFGNAAFTYTFLAQTMGLVSAATVLFFVDTYGRRPVLIIGMCFATFFNFVIAGIGRKSNPSDGEANTIVASLILLSASVKFSASTLAYLVTSEIGGVKLRKKTMGFATAIDVCSAFLITFTLPYLLGDPVNMKAGVGWIMGVDSFIGVIFSIIMVPELKGYSLEEVDELYQTRFWGWQFGKRRLAIDGQEAGEPVQARASGACPSPASHLQRHGQRSHMD